MMPVRRMASSSSCTVCDPVTLTSEVLCESTGCKSTGYKLWGTGQETQVPRVQVKGTGYSQLMHSMIPVAQNV